MAKIKDLFHDLGNFHNKISLGAGISRMELTDDFKNKPMPPEIKKILDRFVELERNAIDANAKLKELKDVVYNITDPATGLKKEKI